MSQRGGSVTTYVRFGDRVYSPIIEDGEADYIVSFEKLEGARWLGCLKKGGKMCIRDRVKSDLILLESDERFARFTFKYFTPTHYVFTNLYRDQLTRNGHPECIYRLLKKSITSDDAVLVLNADDPLVSCFGLGRGNTVYYGASRIESDGDRNTSIYNDGAYCPNCKEPLEYDYYHYNHIGHYHCENCGLHRSDASYEITAADLEAGYCLLYTSYCFLFFPIYHLHL